MPLRSVSVCFLWADVRLCLHRGHCNEVVGDVALFAGGERLGKVPLWVLPGCEKRQEQCRRWVYIFLMPCSSSTYTGLSDSAMTLSPIGTEGPAMQITHGSGWGKCVFTWCQQERQQRQNMSIIISQKPSCKSFKVISVFGKITVYFFCAFNTNALDWRT